MGLPVLDSHIFPIALWYLVIFANTDINYTLHSQCFGTWKFYVQLFVSQYSNNFLRIKGNLNENTFSLMTLLHSCWPFWRIG